MVYNLQSVKVPIFADVNDTPILPTVTAPGNGSHLIAQYNLLIDETESSLNELQNTTDGLLEIAFDNWVVVEDDYIANPGDKVVFKTNQPIGGKTIYYLDVPSNPVNGTTITFINTNASVSVEVRNYGQFNGGQAIRIYTQDQYVLRTLVYVGAGIGWMPTTPDNYLKEFGGGT